MELVVNFKKKFIGDRDFYRRVLLIALPMIGQNAITSFVSFLDNINRNGVCTFFGMFDCCDLDTYS